jgi:hypothetical protein
LGESRISPTMKPITVAAMTETKETWSVLSRPTRKARA